MFRNSLDFFWSKSIALQTVFEVFLFVNLIANIMATFEPTVQKIRRDKTYLVYIRVIQHSKPAYVKTDMYVHEKKVKNGIINDPVIKSKCQTKIFEYLNKLNFIDSRKWTVQEIIDFLNRDSEYIIFSDFCKLFIDRMKKEGRGKSASNYQCAVNSFENYFGKKISFQEITKKKLQEWIATMHGTARAKEAYPNSIKAIFNAGCNEYNDYDRDIIRIKNRPFFNLEIPDSDTPEKRAVNASVIKRQLTVKPPTKLAELAQDVAKMMVYLPVNP